MFRLFVTRYREPLVVWFALSLHMLWAVSMLIDPASGFATAPYAVHAIFGPTLAPLLLFSGCMLAFIGMLAPQRFVSVLLMLPQQTFLFVSAVGAARAVALGQFPDGVIRNRLFILSDQGPSLVLAVLYTIAIIQIARSKESNE